MDNRDSFNTQLIGLLNSCDGLSNLFARMFGDSMIAKSCFLARTKCSYFIYFDIAPYLQDLLLTKVKSSSFFVASYQ